MPKNSIVKKIILIILLAFTSPAYSQTDILVSGASQLVPIATPQLCNEGGVIESDREIPKLIARDLDLSGYFRIVPPTSYIETPGKCGGASNIAYSDWTSIGSDFVVRGIIRGNGDRIQTQLFLIDAFKQAAVLGKEYEGSAEDAPMMAHKFANEILKFFTGELGPFGSKIVFSMKVGRFKELAVMDMDGSNIRQLTSDKGLAKSAAWGPDGRTVAYTNYKLRQPDLFTMDVFSRAIKQITNDTAMEIGPHFLSDGNIIAAKTEGSGSSLVVYDRSGKMTQKLIAGGGAINVSPSYSPDRSQMVFCSDRGGSPQIYLAAGDGSGAKRISFASSNYCTSPEWSPKGDKIAYVCRADGGFNVFVSAPDGTNPLQLTTYGNNEDPDWSPDGRYLVFSSTAGRGVASLAIIRADGKGFRQLTNARNGDTEPTWGPRPQ